jgi:lysine 2,3-aminomutase
MPATKTLRSPKALADAGLIPAARVAVLERVAAQYAVAITPAMTALIEAPDDPIARQFVPCEAELELRAEESADPIGDAAHSPVEGVVHRYPDRCLLTLNHACAVYCRFCFRREKVGPGGEALSAVELEAALA